MSVTKYYVLFPPRRRKRFNEINISPIPPHMAHTSFIILYTTTTLPLTKKQIRSIHSDLTTKFGNREQNSNSMRFAIA
jgi:hypothetical protein